MFYLMNQVGHLDGTFPMQATVFPCCVPDFASALPYLLMLGIGICVAAVLVGAAVGWLTGVLHPKGTARSGALIGTLTGAVSVGLAVTMLLITMHGKWFPHLLGILVAVLFTGLN